MADSNFTTDQPTGREPLSSIIQQLHTHVRRLCDHLAPGPLAEATHMDREAALTLIASARVEAWTAEATTPSASHEWAMGDEVLAARAILEMYTASVGDEDADDRYVLWAIRDKLNAALDIMENGPKETAVSNANELEVSHV